MKNIFFGLIFITTTLSSWTCFGQHPTEEDDFLENSDQRFDNLNQENREMIQRDQALNQQGYDPNERFGRPSKADLKPEQNQFKFIRGE